MAWALITLAILSTWGGSQWTLFPDGRAYCAAQQGHVMDEVYGTIKCESRTWERLKAAVQDTIEEVR